MIAGQQGVARWYGSNKTVLQVSAGRKHALCGGRVRSEIAMLSFDQWLFKSVGKQAAQRSWWTACDLTSICARTGR